MYFSIASRVSFSMSIASKPLALSRSGGSSVLNSAKTSREGVVSKIELLLRSIGSIPKARLQ